MTRREGSYAGVASAAGAVLWLTAPKHHVAPRALDALRVVPSLGKQSSGVAVLGAF